MPIEIVGAPHTTSSKPQNNSGPETYSVTVSLQIARLIGHQCAGYELHEWEDIGLTFIDTRGIRDCGAAAAVVVVVSSRSSTSRSSRSSADYGLWGYGWLF